MADARVAPLRATLRLNTRLFLNCLDGLDESVCDARPNEHTNSIGFIAAHLVDARHLLARVIGLDVPAPFGGAVEQARSIADVTAAPRLSDTRVVWAEISDRVDRQLGTLTANTLDAESPQRYPIEDRTILGAIAFLTQHDAYHIGQLALLRKFHGAPAMRYG